MIDNFGVISTKCAFKGYSEEHRMTKLVEYISLLEERTISRKFSIAPTKAFDDIEKPHRKHGCLGCNAEKYCSACFIKPKMNFFNCEMEKACELCLDLVSQMKTYSTDKNMLKRQPPNKKNEMVCSLVCKRIKIKRSNINSEAEKNILLIAELPMVENRRSERIKK